LSFLSLSLTVLEEIFANYTICLGLGLSCTLIRSSRSNLMILLYNELYSWYMYWVAEILSLK
jgi:hypothetical protein